MKEPRVLMVGPARDVRGGISTVVNTYYELGLDKKVRLKYIASMKDGSKITKIFTAVFAYIKFCFLLKQFDIVHIHMAAQASFFRKAIFIKKAYKKRKKIIIHQHSADFDEFYWEQINDKKRKKVKNIFSMAEKVLVLSEEWAEFFAKDICGLDKIEILYNGVIIPENKKKNYANHNVLFLGRLGERKGIYDLLKAIPEVVQKIPNTMFYLGGDGEIRQCKKIAEEKGFYKNIQFLGWLNKEEKKKYLENCSIFILPSYHEGMPMSVLEAMSYGLAVISTNAGGISQIIENNVNGIRINAGDTSAIQNALICLLQDIKKKERLGHAAVARIKERFNMESNINKIYQLYYEMEKKI